MLTLCFMLGLLLGSLYGRADRRALRRERDAARADAGWLAELLGRRRRDCAVYDGDAQEQE